MAHRLAILVPSLLVLVHLATGPSFAQSAPESWPVELTDPGAAEAPADLTLPMPCGAAMAFQRVDVALDAADPLSDLRLRLGQSDEAKGYAEYLRPAWLRGGFQDSDSATYFFIARYELTQGQYRALRGDCAAPGRTDRLAQGGLSWFDAVQLSESYTEWLYANAPDSLPRQDGALPFLRLPTETEWEFAARGGGKVDPNQFPARRFFAEGELKDYAFYLAPGSSRGKLGPVGLRKPNPLGLFDVYGNAEELMLEPFRLNVLGREHGQPGGIVTRGGSAIATEDQIYSAQRTEYPPFQASTGQPTAGETFGLRLVLTMHVATSDKRLSDVQARWAALAGSGSADTGETVSLDEIIASETEPRRQTALTALQAELRTAQEKVSTALRQSARSTLLAGAVFEDTIIETEAEIDRKATNIRTLVELQRAAEGSDDAGAALLTAQIETLSEQLGALRGSRQGFLLSLRSTLVTLSTDIPEAEALAAFRQLREELELSGETALVAMLDRYWRDLAVFGAEPDMDPEALLHLVRD